ncbi:MAG: Crp/Fnr family transcriptional regulator [Piscinibacter sp.]|nr:Crp/Fnr family transcriptional regulator [Piscinibacter sp.]
MDATALEWLQRVPVFGALREDVLKFLLKQGSVREVAEGDWFFREGDPADAMFVLQRGAVVVLKGWRGREIELHRLEAGDCFGEMALLDLFPRSASIRALSDTSAIVLGPSALLSLFEHDATQFALIQMNIGREICRRLRQTDEMLFRARMGEAAVTPSSFGTT